MQKFKVLVTRKWPDSVEHRLSEKFDATLNLTDVPLDEEQLKEAMLNYDALLPTVTDKISNNILSVENRRVRIVGNFGVGFNNIDIDSAKDNGIVVTNTPEVLTDCTADIAMLLMLGIARRASEGEPIALEYKGPIDKTIQQILGGLRSAATYVGAKDIKDLPKCTTFILKYR